MCRARICWEVCRVVCRCARSCLVMEDIFLRSILWYLYSGAVRIQSRCPRRHWGRKPRFGEITTASSNHSQADLDDREYKHTKSACQPIRDNISLASSRIFGTMSLVFPSIVPNAQAFPSLEQSTMRPTEQPPRGWSPFTIRRPASQRRELKCVSYRGETKRIFEDFTSRKPFRV